MKLHLLRHAKTAQESETGRDFDRPLLEKGHLQNREMQAYFRRKHVSVGHVYCSAAMRTRQTFSEVRDGIACGEVSFHEELYLVEVQDLLKFLWSCPARGDVLLVGHNFGISRLLGYFTGVDDELRTCGYVCIEFDTGHLSETTRDSGTISDRYRPEV